MKRYEPGCTSVWTPACTSSKKVPVPPPVTTGTSIPAAASRPSVERAASAGPRATALRLASTSRTCWMPPWYTCRPPKRSPGAFRIALARASADSDAGGTPQRSWPQSISTYALIVMPGSSADIALDSAPTLASESTSTPMRVSRCSLERAASRAICDEPTTWFVSSTSLHPPSATRTSASVMVCAQRPRSSSPALRMCHCASPDDLCALACALRATPVPLRQVRHAASLRSRTGKLTRSEGVRISARRARALAGAGRIVPSCRTVR
mmetsp:Transcript_50859/g.108619  ORF Transcript_50859/g.108619 Transcript_50859/m.108619 type:complete len:267 (+) Transcript_50859:663-1463(+)